MVVTHSGPEYRSGICENLAQVLGSGTSAWGEIVNEFISAAPHSLTTLLLTMYRRRVLLAPS
jgi:hypothetical protein